MNWDYVAGLFDGEGSIQIKNYPDTSRGRGISVCIGITDGEVLKQLQEFLELQKIKSHIYQRTIPRGKERKPIQWWKISSKWEATKFLEAIKDKAIIKKDKIIEALKFRENLKAFTRPFNNQELDLIGQWTAEGKTLAEIAKLLACGQCKVFKARKILGITGNHSLYYRKGKIP